MMNSPSSGRSRQRLAPIDFERLKREVSVLDVLALYQWQAVYVRGPEHRGPCPVRNSRSQDSTILAVNPFKNAWRCHKCGASGNQLDLAACYFGLSRDESVRVAVALCRDLGISIPRRS